MTLDGARDRATAWTPLLGALIGALFFAWIAGPRALDPREIDWLMKGDWAEHYFGWHYFRLEPWHWPPGTIAGYYAPIGTSIGLTDSIPLVAFALKPLAAWLPTPFQFLGPFVLVSFALQGALAARLLARRVASPVGQVLGATLFVLLPTLLARIGHASLCAHWLILWTLLIATRPAERRHQSATWAALGLVAGLVHPYLAVMVLALLAATAAQPVGTPVRPRLRALGAATAAMVCGWGLAGLFVLDGQASLAAGGLGYYSMNLLAFVTSDGWSTWLPALPLASPGQAYEGFHYLGLGVIALFAMALVTLTRRVPRHARVLPLWPRLVIAIAVAMALFAVSPVVTVGDRTLLNLDGAWTTPLGLFRASGRFAWPLVYVLLAGAIVTVTRRLPGPAGTAVLAAAVAVQIVDLHAAHQRRRDVARSDAFHSWDNPFDDPRWLTATAGVAHLVLVPPPQCGTAPAAYEPAMRLAATHGLSVNAGILSRRDEGARGAYCATLAADVEAGRLRDDSLYVLTPDGATRLTAVHPETVACATWGRVAACTTRTTRTRLSHGDD